MSSRTSLQHSSPEFNENIISKSIKNEKCFFNIQLKSQNDSDKINISNEKRESLSTSSYKFLSWREKDRRRRFRDEWKHMWLVIPHGNFEVMCLVCHKVMTQRKLDTIKRHTVRRHTEVLDMDQAERILLFERLLLEHNSSKFPVSNPNSTGSMKPAKSENGKSANLETEVGDLEKLLSSDCISATSSSSLSPLELQQNNPDSKYYPKRLKYNRKNIKINFKTNQKNDSIKSFSNMKSPIDEKTLINKPVLKSKLKIPNICDNNKSFNAWPNTNLNNRLLSTGNKSFQDSLYNLNGSSCLNLLQSMPMISKCPLCLEDCSKNGVDPNNTFSRLMSHMQQKHSDKLHNLNSSFDLSQPNGSSIHDFVQSLLMSPTNNNNNNSSNYLSVSNANMISFLYYQDLMRQTISSNRSTSSQFCPISSDPMFLQSPSALATSSIYPIISPPSPQYSLRPTSSSISAFNFGPLNDNISHNPMAMEETTNIFNKISPLKRTKFSAESFISDSCPQSAFYSPKCLKVESKDTDFPKTIKPISINQNPDVPKFQSHEFESHIKDTKPEGYLNSMPENKSSSTIHTSSPKFDESMSPKSAAQGNLTCHALRFGPGQDLKTGLLEYVKKKKISAAFIMTCCGSLNQARLRMADSGILNTPLEIKNLTKHFEIVSLVGSVFDHDCHLHISLSDSTGNVIGGHVIGDLIIHTTAEVMLGQICGVQMRREPDENTGYSELSFSSTDII